MTLLEQGAELMLVGMSTVFVFLVLLVLATSLMSRLVVRFSPEAPESNTKTKVNTPDVTEAIDAELLTVITEAIRLHKSGQKLS